MEKNPQIIDIVGKKSYNNKYLYINGIKITNMKGNWQYYEQEKSKYNHQRNQ